MSAVLSLHNLINDSVEQRVQMQLFAIFET